MLDWDSLRYFLEVARSQRVSAAARTLGVEHTTVARRIRALEAELGSLLFEKSRSAGFVLTDDGHRLFVHAEQLESTMHSARESLSGIGQALSGHIRIGATEGFGSYVVTPWPRTSSADIPISRWIFCPCRALSAYPSAKRIWPLPSSGHNVVPIYAAAYAITR
ncbi:bacterial regulatory helix-turn-helix, lysR family protein [Bordetella holmesii 35009]|nr:bacterial regulatory helix-turn-helix, lysR family protein [Bordetella holmesii 35009]